jgi:XRCC1 N terminal domain
VAADNGGRIVSVTDEDPDFPASNLIDSETYESTWFTNEPAQFPQTVVFALANDEVKTINRVVLNPWSSDWRTSWIKDFEIYVSDTSPELDQMQKVGEFTLDTALFFRASPRAP